MNATLKFFVASAQFTDVVYGSVFFLCIIPQKCDSVYAVEHTLL